MKFDVNRIKINEISNTEFYPAIYQPPNELTRLLRELITALLKENEKRKEYFNKVDEIENESENICEALEYKLQSEWNLASDVFDKLTEEFINQIKIDDEHQYKPEFGDTKICMCYHEYYRHFDTYHGMSPVGCKYCGCGEFKENALS